MKKAKPKKIIRKRKAQPDNAALKISVALRPTTIEAINTRIEISNQSTSAFVDEAVVSYLKTNFGIEAAVKHREYKAITFAVPKEDDSDK